MAQESSTTGRRSFMRRLHYWWSLFVAGALLGLLGPPILLFSWLVNKHDLVYPWALFGARAWLRLSGVRVKVTRARVTRSETDLRLCLESSFVSRHCGDVYLHGTTNRSAGEERTFESAGARRRHGICERDGDRSDESRECDSHDGSGRASAFSQAFRLRFLWKGRERSRASCCRSRKARSTWRGKPACRSFRSRSRIRMC